MKKRLFYLTIFAGFFLLYFLTSAGKTPYDYFTRLATALLQGKYYLTENPPWLSELIPLNNGGYSFVNPPAPALLALPFVLLFKSSFEQQYLAHIIGALIAVSTAILSQRIKKGFSLAIWSGLLASAGTIIFYLSANGSVWYLGQITATLFLLLALVEILGKKRPLLLGLLLSAALLSRLQLLLALPFFTILFFKDNLSLKKAFHFATGLSIFVILYSLYNYFRFGNILQTGYRLIPGILQEPWFNRGQFHPAYIKNHLKILLTELPKFSPDRPYVYPSWAGLAIWLTTPAFVFSLLAPLKKLENKLAWLSIVLIGLINFSYGSTGISQFGYRYAVDFYPFLLFLTIKGVAGTGLKKIHWLLLFLGIMVNFWGVLWINKFGWVGF